MTWLDVDGACVHESGGRTKIDKKTLEVVPIISRKTIYNQVADGMRVARLGDSGRRLMFCVEWIDEYLSRKAAAGADRAAFDSDRREPAA